MSGNRTPAMDREAEELYFQHPVRAVPLGPPSTDQLELIRAHVLDDAILETNEPFVWRAIASNDREDAYATRMHRSTLENFATDATDGVAFMNSHRTGGFVGQAELPMGRTFEGKVVGASANGPLRTEVASFTLRGLNLTGLSTDAFIDGLRSGIARDVSVGFYGGEYRCSICDRDMMRDWECRHWPGREYPKLDAKGKEIEGETVRAVAWIHNAHLSELSAVYDGACPGAMVLKARRMAEAGEIRADTIDWLEQRYRIALPHPTRAYAGAEITPPQKEAPVEITPEQVASIRLALTEAGQAPDADIPAAVRAVVDEARGLRALPAEVERLRGIEAELPELRRLADEGKKYRTDEVARALGEGARAYGTDFAEETYRALLEAAPLETVQRMAADWKAIGDKTFPGGRATIEGHEPAAAVANGVPDAAFKTGR
jgi:hypothetical protein